MFSVHSQSRAAARSDGASAHACHRRDALSLLTGLPLLLLAGGTALSDDQPSRPSKAANPTMRGFRTEVLDLLRRRFPDHTFSEGADDAEIRYQDQSIYLGNLFATTRPIPRSQWEEVIVSWFSQALELAAARAHNQQMTAVWESAQALLRPRLVPLGYLRGGAAMVHRPFSRDLVVAYSLDLGKFDRFVSDADATKWQVTADAIEPAAIANLEGLSKDTPIKVIPAGAGRSGGFAAIAQRDAYDASRLLLPGFRSRLIAALGEFVYAGIPNRDLLIAWSRDFPAHAQFIARIREDAQTQPHPLTNEIFVITQAGVRPASDAELTRAI